MKVALPHSKLQVVQELEVKDDLFMLHSWGIHGVFLGHFLDFIWGNPGAFMGHCWDPI